LLKIHFLYRGFRAKPYMRRTSLLV
jgi:hypothetical protein